MYFIDKEDVENYRFAIAKRVFLKIYGMYRFSRDIVKSNCMWCIHPDSNKECIISLFRMPNQCHCILRRRAATGAFASGHPALPAAGVNRPLYVQS